MSYTIESIAECIGARRVGECEATIDWLLTDSRSLSFPEETLFFALTTKRNSGARYIPDLYDRGVRNFVVTEEDFEKFKNGELGKLSTLNFLIVANPLKALQKLAEIHREEFKIPIIGITGSNGKTIVKEWLHQLLSPDRRIVRSPRSYNSQIGVPLSVWQLNEEAELGIFEAGISEMGEMNALKRMIKPTIGILTNIGGAHQENFFSLQEKCMEKLTLFKDCDVVIYNGDNELISNCVAKSMLTAREIAWSRKDIERPLYISRVTKKEDHTVISYRYLDMDNTFCIPFIDDASIENVLNCLAACLYLMTPADQITERMARLEPIAMRLEVKEGKNNCVLINDYNCDEMREDLKAYPEFSKAQVILGGSNTGMSAQASADFEVYGYDMTMTDSVAARLKRELLKVKGVTEVNISRSDYQPEYQVDFDREKLAMHGLNLSTAGNYLRNRVNGAVASKYREDGDEYDIKVRYAPEFRTSLESLENILIYNAQGQSVRVKDVGKVVERFAPPTIERKDRERIVTVSAVISGAPLGDVVADGNAIIDKMDLPSGVSIQISGSYEDQQDSFSDLGTLAVLIVILVFIVMAAQFESLSYPFIIMFSIPFAFSGVLMALFFTGTNLNVMSLLGGIMLIGIVVKNGIVLIDYITLCRERGQAVLHSVVTAGRSRLRPVLMTTLTTILGMVPMAVGQGEGAEMWRPLGVAVIGGLTVSTILTLILVPVLYCSFAGVGIRRTRKKIKKDRELNDYYQLHKEKMTKPRKQ